MNKIFPATANNKYTGNKIPLYFFYVLTAITIIRSLIHIFAPDGGAQSIATIPLNSYSAEASAVVIHVFAEWGLTQLLFGLLYVIVIWKYKNLIPLIYLFIITEYSGRLILGHLKPIITIGIPPGAIENYIMITLAFLMFILSIKETKKA